MDLKEKNAIKQKNALLTIAKKMFIEKGFDSTTTDDIAQEAKVSKRTMYVHFRSKSDIFSYLQFCCLSNFKQHLKANNCRSLSAYITALETYIENFKDDVFYLKSIDLSPQSENAYSLDIKREVMNLIASITNFLTAKLPNGLGQICVATLIFECTISCFKNNISPLEFQKFLQAEII